MKVDAGNIYFRIHLFKSTKGAEGNEADFTGLPS